MENYHCWKADLTGSLLVGNVYDICYITGAIIHTTRETFKGGKNYNKEQKHSRNPCQ